MNHYQIDVEKSIKAEKLVFKKGVLSMLLDRSFELPFILIFPFISGLHLTSKIKNEGSLWLPALYLVIALTVSGLIVYSIFHINKLTRIKGVSVGKNFKVIEEIAKKNKWGVRMSNRQITIIHFPWEFSGWDWGKEITIIYDKKDILINCTSFGAFSTPSPFHWFANKKKRDTFKKEFNSLIHQ